MYRNQTSAFNLGRKIHRKYGTIRDKYQKTLKMNIFPDKTFFHDPYWLDPGDEDSGG